MNRQKIILGAVALVLVAIVGGAGYFVWQTESYMKTNDAWKAQAVANVNANTQNIMTIGSYLQNQIASSSKK